MKTRSFLVGCLGLSAAFLVSTPLHAEDAKKTLTVTCKPPEGAFSDQRPDYLHIKEVVITRTGAQRLQFEVTMLGEIPKNPKESVSIYFGFDIDQDPSTGGVAAHSPNFGQDLGFSIYQNQGDTHFQIASNSVEFKGRSREIKVSGLKVRGDKIEVDVRSELFSMFDSFKFFVSASQRIFEKGKQVSSTQVSTSPVTVF